ncbi:MAG TPA: hypothetical protein VMH83_03510 [Candidatus Acidoferrum sp.]|nr:hypothetical protein [Candidatus Acidoferrum sp.]
MSAIRTTLRLLAATACLGLTLTANAQEKVEYKGTPQVKIDPSCQGQVKVLSQQQNAKGVDLKVEITVSGCDGKCIGSLEYMLVFTAADNREIQWQLSDGWEWRSVASPFTMDLHQSAPPDAKLKEVRSMKIGRCSCSTVKPSADQAPQPANFTPISNTSR